MPVLLDFRSCVIEAFARLRYGVNMTGQLEPNVLRERGGLFVNGGGSDEEWCLETSGITQ